MALEQRVSELAATEGNNNADQTQKVSTLEMTVRENDAARAEQVEALKTELQKHIDEFKEECGRGAQEAKKRLALLERSLWRTFVDLLKRGLTQIFRRHGGTTH